MEGCAGNPAHTRAIDMHDKRLDSHSGDIHEMREMLARLTTIEEQNQQRIDAVEARIADIEARPQKRWDTLAVAMITAFAGGLAGYVLAGLGIG